RKVRRRQRAARADADQRSLANRLKSLGQGGYRKGAGPRVGLGQRCQFGTVWFAHLLPFVSTLQLAGRLSEGPPDLVTRLAIQRTISCFPFIDQSFEKPQLCWPASSEEDPR